MYQKRSSSGLSIFKIILLGVFAGAGFFAYDTWQSSRGTAEQPAAPVAVVEDSSNNTQVDADVNTSSSNTIAYETMISNEAEIFIPSVGIIAPITEAYLDGTSWDVSHLGTSVGHLQGTAWASEAPGNIVLSGHVELSDGRGGVFADLDNVRVGETIELAVSDTETRTYIVVAVNEVDPGDLTPLYPTEFDRLTLITCGGYDFFADEYQVRTVVIADRVS